MNRDLKFRIWNSHYEKWQTNLTMFMNNTNDGSYSFNFSKQIYENYKLQQYTGISDINGKDIYEEDIIKNTTSYEEYCNPAVVVWGIYEKVGWKLAYKPKNYHIIPEELQHIINGNKFIEEFSLSHKGFGRYEVIGNIHENPDLLKNETF